MKWKKRPKQHDRLKNARILTTRLAQITNRMYSFYLPSCLDADASFFILILIHPIFFSFFSSLWQERFRECMFMASPNIS